MVSSAICGPRASPWPHFRGHPLMTRHKFGIFLTLLCYALMTVITLAFMRASQKWQLPSPYLSDVIYGWSLITFRLCSNNLLFLLPRVRFNLISVSYLNFDITTFHQENSYDIENNPLKFFFFFAKFVVN